MLTFHWRSEFVWAKGNRKKNLREQSGERESKKTNGAERGAGGRVAGAEWWAEITEMDFNAERQKQPAPLQCSAQEWSRKSQSAFYVFFFAQSAVRQYNNQTVLSALLERYSVSVKA